MSRQRVAGGLPGLALAVLGAWWAAAGVWADPGCTLRMRPFFDDADGTVPVDHPRRTRADMTPPAPPLLPFDRQVLALCGPPGAPVAPDAVRALLESPRNAPVLDRMRQAVPAPTGDAARLVERLTRAWTAEDGFRHVFCGEPDGRRMAGLHYRGRFLQMQTEGWGGALDPRRGVEEVSPGLVYTLGMEHCHRGTVVETRVKSYPYVLSAADVLVEATRALGSAGPRPGKTVCRHRVRVAGRGGFDAVFVARGGAVVTFYPDVTPSDRLPPCGRR